MDDQIQPEIDAAMDAMRVDLDQLVPCARPVDSGCGVYFLFLGNDLQYIGQSRNILARIGNHTKTKVFDSYAWLPVHLDLLATVEAHLIAKFLPPLNNVIPRSQFDVSLPDDDVSEFFAQARAVVLAGRKKMKARKKKAQTEAKEREIGEWRRGVERMAERTFGPGTRADDVASWVNGNRESYSVVMSVYGLVKDVVQHDAKREMVEDAVRRELNKPNGSSASRLSGVRSVKILSAEAAAAKLGLTEMPPITDGPPYVYRNGSGIAYTDRDLVSWARRTGLMEPGPDTAA